MYRNYFNLLVLELFMAKKTPPRFKSKALADKKGEKKSDLNSKLAKFAIFHQGKTHTSQLL